MKTIWKATVCIVAVLLSFSIYSCGDDDDDAVGSRDLLLGTWNGVYYLSQEWEDGEKVSDSKEDFVNGTNRYSRIIKAKHPNRRIKIVVGRDARISGKMVDSLVENYVYYLKNGANVLLFLTKLLILREY